MKWIRTFPAKIPDNRSYVVDNIPVVYMDKNYLVVLENLIDDTIIVEWDIAFGQEDIETFEKHISDNPDIVHVAPYLLYASGSPMGTPGGGKSEWVHTKFVSAPASILGSMVGTPVEGNINLLQFVSSKDIECDYFGFGIVYLPLAVVQQYLDTEPQFVNDCEFSEWYHKTIGTRVPIHWDVHPVHLHY